MNARECLIDKLSDLEINYKYHQYDNKDNFQKLLACEVEQIADFILADRKRICEPLVKLGNLITQQPPTKEKLINAIHKAIKLAGMET